MDIFFLETYEIVVKCTNTLNISVLRPGPVSLWFWIDLRVCGFLLLFCQI